MVGIKDFEKPSCCMNCEMFDGEYGNCDIIGDTQDFEYQWKYDVEDLIQQKINALKAETEDQNGQTSN